MSSNIQVFLRVRPCVRPSPAFTADADTGSVLFELDKQAFGHEVNNTKTDHKFRFNGLLNMSATQEQVFETIAKPVINDVLGGINGTIFAYGQTGSGKTFTTTGGTDRYEDRGLIPRTLAYMFERFQQDQAQYRMYISYLEIYNDAGYDLLRDDSVKRLEDLPKVTIREDEDGASHLRNLSVNVAASVEDALNLLFMGDTNRVVAETPMNDASTRSHCLFIIWVDSTALGSDVVRRSKMHLVDLAGSERVSRTGVEGTLLKEAKHINLSLHYLEQVIVSLHEKSKGGRGFVPYRNSMMTSVLRDSLGGNCKTTMIGCIATEPSNISESISTCRFAQRVAQVQNNARVNEELDPNLLIARLKREAAELKEEVRIARKEGGREEGTELSDEDVESCRALVLQYISAQNPKEPFVCGSVERLRLSFRLLRDLCRGSGAALGGGAARAGNSAGRMDPAREAALEAEAKKLRLEIAQRDQEIGVLMQTLAKQKNGGSRPFISAAAPSPPPALEPPTAQVASAHMAVETSAQEIKRQSSMLSEAVSGAAAEVEPTTAVAEAGVAASAAPPPAQPMLERTMPTPSLTAQQQRQRQQPQQLSKVKLPNGEDPAELLLDKQRAFEVFRQMASVPASVEENKLLLKDRIAKAKAMGEAANEMRCQINAAKTRLERLRTERAMTAAGKPGNDDAELQDGPEELEEFRKIESFKAQYRDRTASLRQIKGDIDQIQGLLEQHRVRTQRDFETWFASLRRQASVESMDGEKKRQLYERIAGTSPASGNGTSATPAPAG